ncbi:DUF1659 domain-containing protein [Aneurinibacillus sp. REN35]|uniref:DUF1659 domain-containing protein n=1 Tax=Aneurinibacillus sp. REN35 TaxID=3237286 RepID=UPI0035289D56
MAVTSSVSGIQLVLLFQDGVDVKGRMKLAKKVYKNIATTATPIAIHEAATALAKLQTLPLAGVQQLVTTDVVEE